MMRSVEGASKLKVTTKRRKAVSFLQSATKELHSCQILPIKMQEYFLTDILHRICRW